MAYHFRNRPDGKLVALTDDEAKKFDDDENNKYFLGMCIVVMLVLSQAMLPSGSSTISRIIFAVLALLAGVLVSLSFVGVSVFVVGVIAAFIFIPGVDTNSDLAWKVFFGLGCAAAVANILVLRARKRSEIMDVTQRPSTDLHPDFADFARVKMPRRPLNGPASEVEIKFNPPRLWRLIPFFNKNVKVYLDDEGIGEGPLSKSFTFNTKIAPGDHKISVEGWKRPRVDYQISIEASAKYLLNLTIDSSSGYFSAECELQRR